MKVRSVWIALAAVLSVGLSQPSISNAQAQATAPVMPRVDTVRVATFLKTLSYVPYYVARDRGCLDAVGREHGLKFEYRLFGTVPAVNEAVNASAVDIILEADSPAILQVAAGADLQEITPIAHLNHEVLVPDSSSATGMKDLRGKRIGVLFGTGYHFAVVEAMDKLNIRRDEYTLVDTHPGQGYADLKDKKIDAWAIWPPTLQQWVKEGGVKVIPGSPSPMAVYAYSPREFLKRNPKAIDAFVGCMRSAMEYIQRNRGDAIALTAQETNLPPNIVEMSLENIFYGLNVTDDVIRVLNNQAKFMYENGYSTRAVTFDSTHFSDRGKAK